MDFSAQFNCPMQLPNAITRSPDHPTTQLMIRLVLKLALSALIANAAWRLGTAQLTYYRFKDAVTESAQFGGDKSQERLRQRILELASAYDVPVAEDGF